MTVREFIGALAVTTTFMVVGMARADVVTEWNAVTMICVQGSTAPAIPANRGGPPGLMDLALVQGAVHEGRFESYHYQNAALKGTGSTAAAAAAAAYNMLVTLYKADDPCLVGVTNPAVTYAGDAGLQAGVEAAAAYAPLYRPVFTLPTDPFMGGTNAGDWRPTAPAFAPGANGYMAMTAPFLLNRASQFRTEPAAPLTSNAYAREYDEVRRLGSKFNSERTAPQTEIANFWSVNFITQWFGTLRAIVDAHVPAVGDKARLLALAALAAADSQIAVYDSKYHFNFWRPITAIREGDNDGNPNTIGEPAWEPLATTPPYPDHTSGANCLGASIATVLQRYFGTDKFEYQVYTTSPLATVNPRSYTRFSQALDELVEARILQGIHFRSADVDGRQQGTRIGHWAYSKFLRPLPATN
jgi:PAP2 superfamily